MFYKDDEKIKEFGSIKKLTQKQCWKIINILRI